MKYLVAITVIVVAVVAMAGIAWYVVTLPRGSPPSPSILNVSIHDATSTTFTKVLVTVSKVEVHEASGTNDTGWHSLAIQTATFDLLKLSSNVSALLGSGNIPPGNYTQVRIWVARINATVASNGTTVSVFLYSSFLMTDQPFRINASDVVSYMVDLDLGRSFVLMPWGQWYFLPVLGPVVVSKS